MMNGEGTDCSEAHQPDDERELTHYIESLKWDWHQAIEWLEAESGRVAGRSHFDGGDCPRQPA
ncbi:MAG: hypothetical protein ACYDAG_02100 [Chloroflexota bacterium]